MNLLARQCAAIALTGAATLGFTGTALAAGTLPPGAYTYGTFEASNTSDALHGAIRVAADKCTRPKVDLVSDDIHQLGPRSFIAIVTLICR